MAEKEYQRLTRSRIRRTGAFAAFSARASLWLGKDHLLGVDSSGYTEQYKRFYFRDIQAITLRQTRRRFSWNLVLGSLALGLVLFVLLSSPAFSRWENAEIFTASILGGVTLLVLILILINSLRGPGCICHLHTAVQVEELPSLNRVRRAQRTLERLRPLIEAAQGPMTREEFAANLQSHSADAPPVVAQYSPAEPPALIRPYQGKSHTILFWLLLADLPLTAIHMVVQSDWLDALSWLMLLATVSFAIAALIQQRNTDLPDGLRIIPMATLVFTSISFIIALGYGIYIVMTNPDLASRKLSPLDDPVVLVMSCITTSISVILGGLGLVRLRKFRAVVAATSVAEAANTPGQNAS